MGTSETIKKQRQMRAYNMRALGSPCAKRGCRLQPYAYSPEVWLSNSNSNVGNITPHRQGIE